MTATDPRDAEDEALAPALAVWIEDEAGGGICAARRVPGGQRRQAWLVDVDAGGQQRKLFLRYDPSDPVDTGDPYTLSREGAIYRALARTEVPVPAVVAIHPIQQAVLTERADGDVAFYRLTDPVRRTAVVDSFVDALAALHRVDPSTLDLDELLPARSVEEHVAEELDRWEAMYRHVKRLDPMVELGLAWLRDSVPSTDRRVALVQGDTGPGNFLFDESGVTAVLDWEFAHLGDPMEDLGWLSLRAVHEPLPDFEAALLRYERLSGRPLDLDAIRYYRVFAELRVVILRHRLLGDAHPNGDVGNGLVSRVLHRRLFVEALAAATSLEPPPTDLPAPTASERTWLYDAALEQLSHVIVPRSNDPLVVGRAKGVARILKYLRQHDAAGAAHERAELCELMALLDASPADVEDAREMLAIRIREGAVSLEPAVRYLAKMVSGETALMRSAMGALADRHHDRLPREGR